MSESQLSDGERALLLKLAREAIDAAVNDRPLPPLDLGSCRLRCANRGLHL